jgi:hypothetical protein
MPIVVIAGLAGIGAALTLLPGLAAGPSFDAAVFLTGGWLVAQGRVPYADFWDHKPPLIYVIDAALPAAFPWADPWSAVWIGSVAATGGAGVFIALTIRRWAPLWVAALAGTAASIAMGQYALSLGGGLTETFASLALAVAVYIQLDPRDSSARWVVGGLALGIATLISVQALAGAAAILVGGIGVGGPRWRRGAGILIGAALPWLAAAGLMAALGALPAMIDALVTYSSAYRASNVAQAARNEYASTSVAVLCLTFLIVPAVLAIRDAVRDARWRATVLVPAAVWILLTVAVGIGLSRFETHYAIPLAIPLALAGSISLAARSRLPAIMALVALYAVVGTGLSLVVARIASQPLQLSISAETERTARVGAVMAELATPESTAFVWGNEPQLHYLSGIRPASRYLYLLPLTTPGYATPSLVEEIGRSWATDPPELVVDAGSLQPGSPGSPPLLIARPIDQEGRELDILEPLRALVRERYALVEVVDGWPVYRLRSP